MADPRSTEVTWKGAGVGTGVGSGAGASFLAHAPKATTARRVSSAERVCLLIVVSLLLCPGDLQHLAGANEIRVLDGVLVRFEDLFPAVRVAVDLLGDLREAVAGDDSVGPSHRGAGWSGRRARTATHDVGKVRIFVIRRA